MTKLNVELIERFFDCNSTTLDKILDSYVDSMIDTLLSSHYDNIQVNTVSSHEPGGAKL